MLKYVAGIVALIMVSSALAEDGFFYATVQVDGASDLLRIDWDGSVTTIGSTGFEYISGLAWDFETETLYALAISGPLISLDLKTGHGVQIGGANGFGEALNMTFNTDDGLLYANGSDPSWLVAIDPTNGTWSVLNGAGWFGVAFVEDAVSGSTGIFVRRPHEFLLGFMSLPGDTTVTFLNPIGLTWNRTDNVLYGYNCGWDYSEGGVRLNIWIIDQITGGHDLLVKWDLPVTITLSTLEYRPGDSPSPAPCGLIDSDADGDVDLLDYAIFQNCFTGPLG